MVVCKNCEVELFWNWGGWRHADKPCCENPEPKRYDKETLQCLKETEEDG